MKIFLFYSIPMLSFMNETHFKVLFEFSTIQYALSLPLICLWSQWPCVLWPPLSTKGLLQCLVQDINGWTLGVEIIGGNLPFICYFLLHRKCSELCHSLKFQYLYLFVPVLSSSSCKRQRCLCLTEQFVMTLFPPAVSWCKYKIQQRLTTNFYLLNLPFSCPCGLILVPKI